ncbi:MULTISPECIES: acyl-CoA dehydrogenase family protein [Nocardia]|uniref:Acryloyl-CoA reductase (NADH) n=1 Tax=Nocardia cerradoensis TaxID=85688 RepID=A0A231H3B4_9NOCA|nr:MULTISPECIES: acyl-CoA dehydrogenase family protein [Nocardia]OXR43317.1 Acryloyl-CoA reductase (NADH) [Nocardia cerradoensis]PPJ11911.1 acyl-CoA dehydrogenase [Nocardia nova]PPJ16309.1 acyl-CoA dehydrogenase [Nocardia nova]
MDFALSAEQEDLAAGERAWLVKNDPIAARRPSIDDGPARVPDLAARHVVESGLVGLLTAETGGTHVDLAVLVEEHGRAASAVPLAELALATAALDTLDHPLHTLATANAEGKESVPLALTSVDGAPLTVEISGTELRITGTTAPATALLDATGFLVAAPTSDGREVLVHLPANSAGAGVRTLETLDLTRSWSVIELDVTVPGQRWTTVPAGTVPALADALAFYRKMDALGAAERLVEQTVEYAGQRTQFGQPIGSFQAVKHHCADMALRTEAARASLWAAAVALDGADAARRATAVSAAAAYAGEATSTVASLALQVHGGIGFTWEHDLHLLTRRIKVDELLNGSVSWHRRRLVGA